MKKYANGLSHESSKLKMAGAASLQRDRVLVGIPDRENNNNSDLGYARKQIHQEANEWAQNSNLNEKSNGEGYNNRRLSNLDKYNNGASLLSNGEDSQMEIQRMSAQP